MLLPALQLLEQLLRCCDSVCGNGGQVNGLYIYIYIDSILLKYHGLYKINHVYIYIYI